MFKRLSTFFILASITLILIGYASCTAMIAHKDVATATPDAKTEKRLRSHVNYLCRPEAPRYGKTLIQSQKFIERELNSYGYKVELQEFTTSQGESFYNISAILKGQQEERVVLGAHYDACAYSQGDEGFLPGADDNASAVAVLLEIAKRLSKTRPFHTIEFVAYACEEPPWFGTADMGSAKHAAKLRADKTPLHSMICLEMLGYYSDEPGSQPALFKGSSLLIPSVGNFVAVVGNMTARPLAVKLYKELGKSMPSLRLNVPWAEDSVLFFSDHRNYLDFDVPVVMVTNTAMLRNERYHTPQDTPDTLNYGKMAIIAETLSHYLIHAKD